MKRQILWILILSVISMLMFAGCDNDDDNPTTAQEAVQAHILGFANLYPYPHFYADIFPVSNQPFGLDSAFAFDSACQVWTNTYWYVYGDDNYQWLDYSNNNDTLRYESGDTMNLVLYNEKGISSVDIRLLDYSADRRFMVTPMFGDSLPLGADINCAWNSNTKADWYGVYTRYRKDSAGVQVYTHTYYNTEDTTLTIPASANTFNGYYEIYIVCVTGPKPGDPHNVNGIGLVGEIHSYTQSSNTVRVYVGTGDPLPVSGIVSDKPHTVNLDAVASDILQNLFQLK